VRLTGGDDMHGTRGESPVVLMPVFNDWVACGQVIAAVDGALGRAGRRARFLVVNDGSTEAADLEATVAALASTDAVEILHLRRNLGHQRAICVALCELEHRGESAPVVIMDADGEDAPDDVPRLLAAWEADGGERVLFAERTRRSEGALFRVSYWTYRVLHRIFTGHRVRVGNFSVVPGRALRTLVFFPELWSHYAATVFISRLEYTTLPTGRGARLDGRPTMNFVSLVAHGLSAVTVFSEVVAVRVLLFQLGLAGAAGLLLAVLVAGTMAALWIMPVWIVHATILAFLVLLLSAMFAVSFASAVLVGRRNAVVVPVQDARIFIDRIQTLAGDA
jgi:polyisoprenyl-phosphate glycosyltransferase